MGNPPGEHCHPGRQVCIASQIWPGMHIVPAVDGGSIVGIVPGKQVQPAWQICPDSQMVPGMHHADRVGRSVSGEEPVGTSPGVGE